MPTISFYLTKNPDQENADENPGRRHGFSRIVIKIGDNQSSFIGIYFGTEWKSSTHACEFAQVPWADKFDLLYVGDNTWYETACRLMGDKDNMESHIDNIKDLAHRFWNTMFSRDTNFRNDAQKAELFCWWLHNIEKHTKVALDIQNTAATVKYLEYAPREVLQNRSQSTCRNPQLPIKYERGQSPCFIHHSIPIKPSKKDKDRLGKKMKADIENRQKLFRRLENQFSKQDKTFRNDCKKFALNYDGSKHPKYEAKRAAHLKFLRGHLYSAIDLGLGDDHVPVQSIDRTIKHIATPGLFTTWLQQLQDAEAGKKH